MLKEDIDFPRGGKKVKRNENLEDKPTAQPQQEKKEKKRFSQKRRIDADESPFNRPAKVLKKESLNVEGPLHNDVLTVGLVVLGCVKQVLPHSISVSLPGNHTASIPITNVSDAYTELLNQLSAQDDFEQSENVSPLTELIQPGLFISVAIKSIKSGPDSKKKIITGSCKPCDINANIPKAAVKKGMLLMTNVGSVEDHGYRMETGIKGLYAFLKNADAENYIDKYCPEEKLCVGKPLWCIVNLREKKSGEDTENRVINITIAPDEIQKAKLPAKVTMNGLSAGMKVTANIKTVGEQGLLVTFGSFEGLLHGSHLPLNVQSYSVGAMIEAAILYVHPEMKTIYLTGLKPIVQHNGCAVHALSGVEIGDIVDAKIQRQVRKKGIYLKLPKGRVGFAALCQLTDDKTTPDIKEFAVGQSVKCRIMGFNYMEGLLLVTLKKSILEQKYISVKSMKVGDFVEGTIVDVLPKGVTVRIAKKIHSFIPRIHMTDVPLTHLNKRFETGMAIKCRVFQVSKSKVLLTHKPALMKAKLGLVTDYAQLSRNEEVIGVITAIKEAYLLVRFFNGVQGIVTATEMGLTQGQSSQELFYKGQVVRCRIVNVDSENEKLKLSFNLSKQKAKKEPEAKQAEEPPNLAPGMVTQAKIINVGSDSYKVVLLPSKYPAVLPFDHLSDYREIQDLRKLTLAKGHILQKVTFFNKRRQCIVTMKESFLQGSGEKLYAEKLEDLEVGMVLPGVVKNHQDYGFFIELAGGHTGLCPARALHGVGPSALKDHYPEGRSVLTRIVRIDKEKGRFLGSIAKQDIMNDGLDDPVKFLEDYLKSRDGAVKELSKVDEKLTPYNDVKVGSVVEVTVTTVYKKGVLCELSSGLKAIATHDHLGDLTPDTGKRYPAVVLALDLLAPCLEVTLDSKVCKAVETREENASSMVKVGQTLKAELLLSKPEFLLMNLKGHATGKLVYIPKKQHFNDVNIHCDFEVGMYSDVVIKGNTEGVFIGALKMKGNKLSKLKAVKTKAVGNDQDGKENVDIRNLPLHDVQVGDVLDAKVKAIHPLQMNVVTGHAQGRVHITEVSDDVLESKNPLYNYHGGDMVKVKVIGLRMAKSQSYMPITKPKVTRTLLECSLKLSKMDKTDPKDLLHEELSTFVGAEMTVYVIKVDKLKLWVQASLMHQGSVSLFQASKNVDVINKAAKHFKIGQPLKATVTGKTEDDKITLSLIGPDVKPEVGKEVTALITGMKKSEFLSVKLSDGSAGTVDLHPGTLFSIGQFIRCKVVSVSNKGVYKLSLPEKLVERKRKASLTISENGNSSSTEEPTASKKKVKKCSVAEKEITSTEKIKKKDMDEESKTATLQRKTVGDKKTSKSDQSRLMIEGFTWGGDLPVMQPKKEVSSDDDDGDDRPNATDIKSKRKRKRDQEKVIEELEKQQLEGNSGPQSSNDFERLVLQSPNSSMVWLGYMAYHLGLGEVAKARAVAEKALATIVFREEQEKKNVWLAYLNLEAMYGDNEDLKKLLQRAVTYNDPLEIQLKMCDIYAGANKMEDAEQQYQLLIRKFKKEKSVWKSYAQFLYKQDRQDSARNILKRCLTALEKRDHVEVISRFANLEFSFGNPERGRTMFENLIASYPGRTDIWSVYVDMVVKSGDIEGARQLLERACKQKLNTKKLSFLVQKFIKFEETHGTEDRIQKVKDMAVTLFDS